MVYVYVCVCVLCVSWDRVFYSPEWTKTCYVAKDDHQLHIFFAPPPHIWDHSYEPLYSLCLCAVGDKTKDLFYGRQTLWQLGSLGVGVFMQMYTDHVETVEDNFPYIKIWSGFNE